MRAPHSPQVSPRTTTRNSPTISLQSPHSRRSLCGETRQPHKPSSTWAVTFTFDTSKLKPAPPAITLQPSAPVLHFEDCRIMPKTPACSPLKRGPSQRFPPSLLISYVESPTQQSYVIPTEDVSDADDEEEEVGESGKREYQDVHITPKAPEQISIRASDADSRGATASPNVAAVNPKVSVASRLQSARQALADARRRSFQLGERSLSATFQQMRSYSLSSVRCADMQGTPEASSSSNNDNNNNMPRPISSNQAEEQEEKQQQHTEPETRHQLPTNIVRCDNQEQDQQELTEPEPQKHKQQQKKRSSARTRAVSYQSALTKYLPNMFSRNARRTNKASASMEPNDESCDNNTKNNQLSSGSIESTCDKGENASRKAKSSTSAKRLSKWTLCRNHHHQQQQAPSQQSENESDNQREHERESLRPTTRVMEEVGSDTSCSER